MKKNIKKSQINNKKMKNTLSIVCFLLLPLCVYSQNDRKNNVKVESISPRYTQEELITIKQKIVQEGNKDDYYELLLQSKGKSAGWNSEYEFLLPYALILANKYEDGFACYEVYQLTKTFYEDNNMQIDPISSQFIMHYLLKGAQLGKKDCLRELENLKTNSCEDELKGQ